MAGVGNLSSTKDHFDTYNIIHGRIKIMYLKISLLPLVKHLINSYSFSEMAGMACFGEAFDGSWY